MPTEPKADTRKCVKRRHSEVSDEGGPVDARMFSQAFVWGTCAAPAS